MVSEPTETIMSEQQPCWHRVALDVSRRSTPSSATWKEMSLVASSKVQSKFVSREKMMWGKFILIHQSANQSSFIDSIILSTCRGAVQDHILCSLVVKLYMIGVLVPSCNASRILESAFKRQNTGNRPAKPDG